MAEERKKNDWEKIEAAYRIGRLSLREIGATFGCSDTEVVLPMFPKGIRQMLGWAYAMEGVDPHGPSAHAKLIEQMDDGEVVPFSLAGINLKGMPELERFGLAANLRQKVEESITCEQRSVIWAKYADLHRGDKQQGMIGIVDHVEMSIPRGRRAIADCVWHIVCTDRQREDCTMYAIGRRHGISAMTVCRDIRKIRDYMLQAEDSAIELIKKLFPGGDVI